MISLEPPVPMNFITANKWSKFLLSTIKCTLINDNTSTSNIYTFHDYMMKTHFIPKLKSLSITICLPPTSMIFITTSIDAPYSMSKYRVKQFLATWVFRKNIFLATNFDQSFPCPWYTNSDTIYILHRIQKSCQRINPSSTPSHQAVYEYNNKDTMNLLNYITHYSYNQQCMKSFMVFFSLFVWRMNQSNHHQLCGQFSFERATVAILIN